MGDGDRATLRARWPGPDHVRRRRASNRRPEAIRRLRRVQPTTGGINTFHARARLSDLLGGRQTHPRSLETQRRSGSINPPICRRNRVCAPHRVHKAAPVTMLSSVRQRGSFARASMTRGGGANCPICGLRSLLRTRASSGESWRSPQAGDGVGRPLSRASSSRLGWRAAPLQRRRRARPPSGQP